MTFMEESTMRGSSLLLPFLAALGGSASAQSTEAGPPASFQSIELRGGGIVTVRHGAERRVTVLRSNPDRPIRTDGNRLVIDRCSGGCPRGHHIEVEVITPEISRLAVTDGGRIELHGDFPPQAAIAGAVSSGGLIDMRPLEAARVTVAIEHGGRILARPGQALTASVSNGGNVTYWGDPSVTSAIDHGGAVEPGDVADLRSPVSQLDERLVLPPVPAVIPATPSHRTRKP